MLLVRILSTDEDLNVEGFRHNDVIEVHDGTDLTEDEMLESVISHNQAMIDDDDDIAVPSLYTGSDGEEITETEWLLKDDEDYEIVTPATQTRRT